MLQTTSSLSLIEALAGAKRIVLVGHKAPDGDCIGSMLGLHHYLLSQNHVEWVTPMVQDPIPDNLRWLPGADSIEVVSAHHCDLKKLEQRIQDSDMIILLDLNHLGRIGDLLESWITEAVTQGDRRIIMVDHHPNPDTTHIDHMYSDTECCATAYLLSLLLEEKSTPRLSADTAQCLLVGIYTDTGLLNHGTLTPALFRQIAHLIECGGDVHQIIQKIFKSDKLDRHRLLGYIINERTTYDMRYGLAVFSLRIQDLQRFNLTGKDTEGLVNVPLSVEGIRAVAFLREQKDPLEPIKISLRSEGNLPVNEVAAHYFGGGGHRNAAGAEYKGSLIEALQLTWQGLRNLAQQYPPTPEAGE